MQAALLVSAVCYLNAANFTLPSERVAYVSKCLDTKPIPTCDEYKCGAVLRPDGIMSCDAVYVDPRYWFIHTSYDSPPVDQYVLLTPIDESFFDCKLFTYYGTTLQNQFDYARRCVSQPGCVVISTYDHEQFQCVKENSHLTDVIWTSENVHNLTKWNSQHRHKCALPCSIPYNDNERVDCMRKCIKQHRDCVATIDDEKQIDCRIKRRTEERIKTFVFAPMVTVNTINPSECRISDDLDFEQAVAECTSTQALDGQLCLLNQAKDGSFECMDPEYKAFDSIAVDTLDRCKILETDYATFIKRCLARNCTPIIESAKHFICADDYETERLADVLNKL
jgi:hypothetical protein